MSKKRGIVERLLAEAQQKGRCAIGKSSSESRALRKAVEAGDLVCPFPGVFYGVAEWLALPLHRKALYSIRALACKHPTWVFCGASAALIWGLEPSYAMLKTIQVISTHRYARYAGLVTRCPASDDCIVVHGGVRVTDFWQTVADCMRVASFAQGLVVADAALRVRHAGCEALDAAIESYTARRRGVAKARCIAKYADGRSESGGESRVRAFLIQNGFSLPDLQVEIACPLEGNGVYRVDFFWRLPGGKNVVGEFDGAVKYIDPLMAGGGGLLGAMMRERQRESRLTLYGFPVVRINNDDLKKPQILARQLRAAGIPQSSEAAARWRLEWAAAQPRSACRAQG